MALALGRFTPAVIHSLRVPVQVALYAGLFVFAEQLVTWGHLPLPANLVGMLLLLALIVCRIVPLKWVREGSKWLLAEMLLFFVPAVVPSFTIFAPRSKSATRPCRNSCTISTCWKRC